MFRNRNLIQQLKKMHNQNKKINKELKDEMAELRKSNAELTEEVTSVKDNKDKSWWEQFSNDSNIEGAQKVTFLGSIFTSVTGISLTTISINSDDDPKPIVQAVIEHGKTDYVSIEREYNHCVSLEIWDKNEKIYKETDT